MVNLGKVQSLDFFTFDLQTLISLVQSPTETNKTKAQAFLKSLKQNGHGSSPTPIINHMSPGTACPGRETTRGNFQESQDTTEAACF